ncbi:hypothetical protein QZH45_14085 [Pseudomonas corrugata]|uniref:Uncharacterized protein n=1 Tax=Pseudomonas canavaninivorans TaxID=2842348 RepID=A0ABX8QK67_PSECO|nr:MULTISPECIES: hypothetical protein [Pseudomonas]QXI55789.1 hypothetical protein KSS97_12915 [Pseudomonas alvandae]UVM74904.1 hypothetical protein LOY40_12365 [Pseudomonas canavaninivorans]
MKPNAINSAVGALKLVPMFLNHPTVISRATLIGASAEAVELLEALPCVSVELAEVFRCVDAVIGDGQVAYVTPVNCPEYPYGAVVADAKGNVLAAAKGKSKEGLAELIRLKLVPQMEGHGGGSA